MKRETVETGIYRHDVVTLESVNDMIAVALAGVKEARAMKRPSDWLGAIEREATAAQANPVSDRQARDLKEILQLVALVRVYLERGDVALLTTHAIKLGMVVERAKVRRAEKRALQPILRKRDLIESAKARGHSPDEIDGALSRYDELCAAGPGRKKRAIQEQVAEETGIPARTLRYHLTKRSQ
ncbi:MAG TPA: hypothetical protein VMY37_11020 [Thermoguttaceae bacterium]|nr:hypothetical protein [Thermoguttaceae bacterium]